MKLGNARWRRGIGLIEALDMNGIPIGAYANQQRAYSKADRVRCDTRSKHQLVPFPCRIEDRIDPIAEVEHIGIGARAAGQDVGTGSTGQFIVARPTLQFIVPVIAEQEIRICPTYQQIVPSLAHQEIGARAAIELVISFPTKQGIVAHIPDQQVITGSAIQLIIARLAE